MAEEGRGVMAEMVTAQCSCGNLVRVPSAFAGKKVRCPSCRQAFVVPSAEAITGDIVTDEMLPEVASDNEVLDAEEVETTPAARPPSRRGRRPGRRSSQSSVRLRGQSGGAAGRGKGKEKGGRFVPRAKKSPVVPIVIAVVIGVVAIVVVAVFATQGGGGEKAAASKAQPVAVVPEIDPALQARVQSYARTFNRANHNEAMEFFRYSPEQKQPLLQSLSALWEQGTRYENVNVTSARPDTGTVTFRYSAGGATQQKTLQWGLEDGTWRITGEP